MRKTPVFAYLRVSGKGQIKGDGFPRQLAAIRKYTAEHDMRIVQVFEEKAVPGKTEWEQRPAWLAMLQKITSNGVHTILIERLDRLARDLMVQEHIIADLRKLGVTLVSVAEPDLCVDDPSRKLLRQIMGAKRADTGRCEGRKRYGEKPGESSVRDRIRLMRKGGATLRSICDMLNGEGLTTRYGRPWMLMTVQRICRH
jgi:hypothetical protein